MTDRSTADGGPGTVAIDRIAAGGDGVGTLGDGRRIFVPRTAPGDVIEVGDIRLADRYARGRVARLVTPSPDRVEPRCGHYQRDRCGGCQLQHMSTPAQETARRGFVGDALRRLGRLDVADPEIDPAENQWSYRTKISIARGPHGFGFRRLHEPNAIFQLVRCEIAAEPLNTLWSALREEIRSLPATTERVTLRQGRGGGLHVIVKVTGSEAWTRAKPVAAALVAKGQAATLWWQPEGGVVRAVAGGESTFPATVFEQVHPAMGDRVRRYVVDSLGPVKGLLGWDLYSGIGETGEMLAARGASVESIELDRRAVEEAIRRNGAGAAVRPIVGKVEDEVGKLAAPDFVVANPPRAGMDARVIDALRRSRPRAIRYISCDAPTLARDVKRLQAPGGPVYRVTDIRAFDLFPQTAHVETVLGLELS
ncbi:MAG: hypothetical protein ABI647_07585 [Gemmatimonadota bacterium]